VSLPELLANRPKPLDAKVVAALAARYGISGTQASLASERDQNVLISQAGGKRYVLKIKNPAEPPELAQLEIDVLMRLERALPDVDVPHVLGTLDGQRSIACPTPDGVRCVRLLSYVPGRPLADLKSTAKLRLSVGETLARISLVLAGIHGHTPSPPLPWDLYQFVRLSGLLLESCDGELARRNSDLIARWRASGLLESPIRNRTSAVPLQLLHNDFNPYNILIRDSVPDRVSGVIDFGDMAFGPPVFDLAVALAYWFQERDALAAMADVACGFHRVRPLRHEELELLPLLIETRLMMTVLITRWRAERNPENRAYILRNEPAARAGLSALRYLSAHDLCSYLQRRLSSGAPA